LARRSGDGKWWNRYGRGINVKDFGAVGSGIADDIAAIAAAVIAARSGTGIVYFPPGTYLTDPITDLEYGMTLCGAGAMRTFIKARQNYKDAITCTGRPISYLNIKDLSIRGQGMADILLRHVAASLTVATVSYNSGTVQTTITFSGSPAMDTYTATHECVEPVHVVNQGFIRFGDRWTVVSQTGSTHTAVVWGDASGLQVGDTVRVYLAGAGIRFVNMTALPTAAIVGYPGGASAGDSIAANGVNVERCEIFEFGGPLIQAGMPGINDDVCYGMTIRDCRLRDSSDHFIHLSHGRPACRIESTTALRIPTNRYAIYGNEIQCSIDDCQGMNNLDGTGGVNGNVLQSGGLVYAYNSRVGIRNANCEAFGVGPGMRFHSSAVTIDKATFGITSGVTSGVIAIWFDNCANPAELTDIIFGADTEFLHNAPIQGTNNNTRIIARNLTAGGNTPILDKMALYNTFAEDPNDPFHPLVSSPTMVPIATIGTDYQFGSVGCRIKVNALNVGGNAIIENDGSMTTPKLLTAPGLKNTIKSVVGSGAIAWNPAVDGTVLSIDLQGTSTLSAMGSVTPGVPHVVFVKNAGGFVLHYAAQYLFPGGSAPVNTATAQAIDAFEFMSYDGAFVINTAIRQNLLQTVITPEDLAGCVCDLSAANGTGLFTSQDLSGSAATNGQIVKSIADASGSGNYGHDATGATLITSDSDSKPSLNFGPTNTTAKYILNSLTTLNSQDCSLLFVFNNTSAASSSYCAMMGRHDSNTMDFVYRFSDNLIGGELQDSGGGGLFPFTAAAARNTWHCFGVQYFGGSLRMFLDGTFVAGVAAGANLTMGWVCGNGSFGGTICMPGKFRRFAAFQPHIADSDFLALYQSLKTLHGTQ